MDHVVCRDLLEGRRGPLSYPKEKGTKRFIDQPIIPYKDSSKKIPGGPGSYNGRRFHKRKEKNTLRRSHKNNFLGKKRPQLVKGIYVQGGINCRSRLRAGTHPLLMSSRLNGGRNSIGKSR